MISTSYLNEFNSPIRQIKGRAEVYSSASTLVNTFTYSDALKEIEISREGEKSKFFGFGIGQKATIKLIDRDRLLNIGKENYVKIDFRLNENDFVSIYPDFFVSEAKRDENTNELTIVATDYLEKMLVDTVSSLGLESYTIREFAAAASSFYELSLEIQGVEDQSCFDLDYPNGANFEGTESIRSALNAVAEATQTIYFISGQKLIFKRLNLSAAADLVIEKQHYFTLESKEPRTLGSICHATELGNNVTATSTLGTDIQYVRDNPFWEMREDLGTIVEDAITAIAGLTIVPFSCSWRGNFLLEPGDKVEFIAKDNTSFVSYVLSDKISYKGGFSQTSDWSYEKEQETASNPSTLGEALKQTYARVDKQNGKIELVAKDIDKQNEAIASIELTVDGIRNSVVGDVNSLEQRVAETYLTKDEFNVYIPNEIGGQNYSFKGDGLWFEDQNPETKKQVKTVVNNTGMRVYGDDEEKLTANDEGVKAVDLHATTFLIVGKNSRFEDMGSRTACFWIGGNS